MQTETLLIEIGTEELPPNDLSKLAEAFTKALKTQCEKLGLPFGETFTFATPRRLGVMLKDVPSHQPDSQGQRRGPTLKAAYDDQGNPTKALTGFAQSCGVDIKALSTLKTEKGEWLVHNFQQKGKPLSQLISTLFHQASAKLPIAKKMRWGDSTVEFVRPVHWLLTMHGDKILPLEAFEITASNQTRGHRFHAPQNIPLKHANDYENALKDAKVIANFDKRRQLVLEGIEAQAKKMQGKAHIDESLLNEVTGLVEWPVILTANFDKAFLTLPKEALITAMQHHQRSFAVFGQDEKLLPQFIFVSNTQPTNAQNIITGNERVMTARLSDAKFFYEQDNKTPLASRVEGLQKMLFQKQLGSLFDKSKRVSKLASYIAEEIDGNAQWAKRAGLLCKADLLTEMVFEFPELQGVMGYYYAKADGEPDEVATALHDYYRPRYAKDSIPETKTACALAVADRLDTLVGIFSIGGKPTGEKDPFALRRAAVGVLRILVEKAFPLDLAKLLETAAEGYPHAMGEEHVPNILAFCFERFRAWFLDDGLKPQVIDAVMAIQPTNPYDFYQRVQAVNHFLSLPEAQSLSAANKRVRNILTKSNIPFLRDATPNIQEALLQQPAEKTLFNTLQQHWQNTRPLVEKGEYTKALSNMAALKQSVDTFFDEVMVMTEEEALRENRVQLVCGLLGLFMQVADISKLSM